MAEDTKLVIVADGSGTPPEEVPLTAEEKAQRDDDAALSRTQQQAAGHANAADVERLAVVSERAAEDPAFAALADLTLRGRGV